MTDSTKRDELAEAYEQQVFKDNPTGFTVAPYVNGDVISQAFSDGFDAGKAESEIRKHANAIKDKAMAEALSRTKDRAEKLAAALDESKKLLENCDWDCCRCGKDPEMVDTDLYKVICETLAEYRKGVSE